MAGKVGCAQEAGLQPSLLGNGSKELMVFKGECLSRKLFDSKYLKDDFLGK